jgi:hypothetical protein
MSFDDHIQGDDHCSPSYAWDYEFSINQTSAGDILSPIDLSKLSLGVKISKDKTMAQSKTKNKLDDEHET